MGNIELDYVDICRRIRAERRRQNMTQEALAELAELSPTSVSHIERSYKAEPSDTGKVVQRAADIRRYPAVWQSGRIQRHLY